MVRPDRDRLGGPGVSVEIDETNIGGRTSGQRYANKTKVIIAVERMHPKGLGRVRMRVLKERYMKAEIEAFVAEVVTPGSIVWTDGAVQYSDIAEIAHVTHEPISLVHHPDPAHAVLPAVHRVASLLKRWLAGTFHNGYSETYLDYYLDEYTFRFNRRNSRSRGLLFYRLCQQAVNTDPQPLNSLRVKSW